VRWWPDSRDTSDAGSVGTRRTQWLQRYADAILADPLHRGRLRCQLSEPGEKVTVCARSA
jgi:hypothetical protein